MLSVQCSLYMVQKQYRLRVEWDKKKILGSKSKHLLLFTSCISAKNGLMKSMSILLYMLNMSILCCQIRNIAFFRRHIRYLLRVPLRPTNDRYREITPIVTAQSWPKIVVLDSSNAPNSHSATSPCSPVPLHFGTKWRSHVPPVYRRNRRKLIREPCHHLASLTLRALCRIK